MNVWAEVCVGNSSVFPIFLYISGMQSHWGIKESQKISESYVTAVIVKAMLKRIQNRLFICIKMKFLLI